MNRLRCLLMACAFMLGLGVTAAMAAEAPKGALTFDGTRIQCRQFERTLEKNPELAADADVQVNTVEASKRFDKKLPHLTITDAEGNVIVDVHGANAIRPTSPALGTARVKSREFILKRHKEGDRKEKRCERKASRKAKHETKQEARDAEPKLPWVHAMLTALFTGVAGVVINLRRHG